MRQRNDVLAVCFAVVGLLLAFLADAVYAPPEAALVAPVTGGAEAPRRVAIATPSVCEIVFHLGAGDRVVGVSDFCTHPPEALEKEKIGGWLNPNRERILALKPDLVITQGKHEVMAKLCAEKGITFFSIEVSSLADIRASMLSIGSRLGVEERADEAARAWDEAIEEIRQRVANRPQPLVFLTISRTPGRLAGLMTPGPDTFLSDLISVAGGKNVFADAESKWPTISKEALVVRKPDMILEFSPADLDDEKRAALRADWKALPNLPAVKEGRVHILSGDHLLLPGPRAVDTVRTVAQVLHPEAFDE